MGKGKGVGLKRGMEREGMGFRYEGREGKGRGLVVGFLEKRREARRGEAVFLGGFWFFLLLCDGGKGVLGVLFLEDGKGGSWIYFYFYIYFYEEQEQEQEQE